jgi:hypothetical protein
MTGSIVFVVVAAILIAIALKLMWDIKRAHKPRDEGGETGRGSGDSTPDSPE